jgi:alkylated DNA nucleotide flippase Atl1
MATTTLGPALVQFLSDVENAVIRLRDQLAAEFAVAPVGAEPVVRGERQESIARLPELAGEQGLTAGEISRKVEYDEANTYTVLSALEKTGLLERVEGSPRRWRLAGVHRRDPILRASGVIGHGEWTTYGDIAVAAAGNKNVARAVGRLAAKHPAFANPHRVMQAGGTINPGWSGSGGGREKCRQMLEGEGIAFHDDHADPRKRIGWEEIEARVRALAILDD